MRRTLALASLLALVAALPDCAALAPSEDVGYRSAPHAVIVDDLATRARATRTPVPVSLSGSTAGADPIDVAGVADYITTLGFAGEVTVPAAQTAWSLSANLATWCSPACTRVQIHNRGANSVGIRWTGAAGKVYVLPPGTPWDSSSWIESITDLWLVTQDGPTDCIVTTSSCGTTDVHIYGGQ